MSREAYWLLVPLVGIGLTIPVWGAIAILYYRDKKRGVR